MLKIRKAAFETNSSSMHTIILAGKRTKTESPDFIYGDGKIMKKKLIITFDDIDFSAYSTGKVLTTWTDRLCYALAYYYTKHGADEDCIKEINESFEKLIHEEYPDLIIQFPKLDGYTYLINHQSSDTLDTFLDSVPMQIKDFIFNDNIFVYTPSDGCEDSRIIDLALDYGFKDLKTITRFEDTYEIKDDKEIICDYDRY